MAVTSPKSPKPDTLDEENLLRRVRPDDWQNPEPKPRYDLAIIGGGPAGLSAAQTAIRLGLSVALVERNRLGGNSLNTGSVPSKTVVRTARVYATTHRAEEYGAPVSTELPADFLKIMARMKGIRTRIAEYSSAERLRTLGVDVFFGEARFTGADALTVGGKRLAFRKALVATGARPRPSSIPGLEEAGYHTSNSIFELTSLPRRIAVIGGGPLGCEAAQAFCRLGSHVTIVQDEPKFLPHEERDASQLLSFSLARDGVDTRLNTTAVRVRQENGTKILETSNDDAKYDITADEILLSIGTIANTEGLGLEAAGIADRCREGNCRRRLSAHDKPARIRGRRRLHVAQIRQCCRGIGAHGGPQCLCRKAPARQPHDDTLVHLLRSGDRPCRPACVGRQRTIHSDQELHGDDAGCRSRHNRRPG